MATKGSKQAAIAAPSLNVYKKLTIVRHPEDTVSFEDAEGNTKSLSTKDLGDVIVTATPSLKKKQKNDIPVPQINIVGAYEKDLPASYDVKRSYVRYHRQTDREWKEGLDYVVDTEDEAWLEQNARFGGAVATTLGAGDSANAAAAATGENAAAPKVETAKEAKAEKEAISILKRPPQLSLESLEVILDLLEKATGFDAIITLHQAEVLLVSKMPELLHLFPLKGRGVVKFKQMLNDVYAYWVSKRSKLKRPLLRQYWPVTSTDDTNPHLVFRPREKEKYKLRKKRQNDLESFRKMKQLRSDFDNLRAVLELVKKREELHRTHVQLQVDLFQQRLHDIVDTSGTPRDSSELRRDQVKRALDIPLYFDLQAGSRKVKRIRTSGEDEARQAVAAHASSVDPSTAAPANSLVGHQNHQPQHTSAGDILNRVPPQNVAGRNHGEPAPNFLHPLQTRESYVTSWDNAVPYVTSYADSHAVSTFRFRHRPRIGRGGRVCIDRLPLPHHDPAIPRHTVLRAGLPPEAASSSHEKPETKPQHLLDLLPRPLDHARLRRRIEEISVAAISEDFEAKTSAASLGTDPQENDGDEVVVRIDDWLNTDDQLWGEERFTLGPV